MVGVRRSTKDGLGQGEGGLGGGWGVEVEGI